MKGGIAFLVVNKTISFVVGICLIAALFVAMLGPKSAGSAFGTVATVTGEGAGIGIGALPKFVDGFKSTAPKTDSSKSKGGKN